jgi:hypothetical protein
LDEPEQEKGGKGFISAFPSPDEYNLLTGRFATSSIFAASPKSKEDEFANWNWTGRDKLEGRSFQGFLACCFQFLRGLRLAFEKYNLI